MKLKSRVIISVLLGLIIGGIMAYQVSSPTENSEKEKTYCTPESREGEFCTAQYDPVCGWFNETNVKCVTYPCAITAGNACGACLNKDVAYWTKGECP